MIVLCLPQLISNVACDWLGWVKPHFWAKNFTDKPTGYQNGHNNHFYCILQNCKFPIYS